MALHKMAPFVFLILHHSTNNDEDKRNYVNVASNLIMNMQKSASRHLETIKCPVFVSCHCDFKTVPLPAYLICR